MSPIFFPGTGSPSSPIAPPLNWRLHRALTDDLAPLTGLTASGSIDATLDTVQVQGKLQARIHADMQHLAFNGDNVDRLTMDARIADPVQHPNLTIVVGANGIRQRAFTGNGRLTAMGTRESLALRLSSDFQIPQGPMKLSAAATARLPQRDLLLSSLTADYGGEFVHLLSPPPARWSRWLAALRQRLPSPSRHKMSPLLSPSPSFLASTAPGRLR